tara:strand:+ start:32856 stop:33482 length:627 start_codon:yes stop_codon:yes gene_type:complete
MFLPIKNMICLVALMAAVAAPVKAACTASQNNLQNTKPDSIYTDHEDGTVTDTQTGLMWTRCAVGVGYHTVDHICNTDDLVGKTEITSWNAAMSQVGSANNSAMYGYSDWRLPNIKELASLVDIACHTNAESSPEYSTINNDIFELINAKSTAMPSDYYLVALWSSTPYIGENDKVLVVRIKNGEIESRPKSAQSGQSIGLLMVRDGD